MSAIQSAFPGIQIGSVNISYFGLIILVAVFAGGAALWRSAPRFEDSLDVIVDLIIVSFISALVLGRLAYVLTPPPSVEAFYSREWYFSHMSDLLVGPLAIWSGGLDSGGILIGALLGARLVIWRRQLPYGEWANSIALAFTIVLALAPLANLINSQQMGPPTSLPWGFPIEHRFPPIDNLAAYPAETRFHPTPAYVSIWAIVVLVLMPRIGAILGFRTDRNNSYMFHGIFLFPGLFFADFLRLDTSHLLLGLTTLQCACAALWLVLVAQVFTRTLKQTTEMND